jgi:hypothetical protein
MKYEASLACMYLAAETSMLTNLMVYGIVFGICGGFLLGFGLIAYGLYDTFVLGNRYDEKGNLISGALKTGGGFLLGFGLTYALMTLFGRAVGWEDSKKSR